METGTTGSESCSVVVSGREKSQYIWNKYQIC